LVGENSFNNEVVDFSSEKHYSVYYSKTDNKILIKKESAIEDVDNALISSGYNRYISRRDDKFIENTYTKAKLLDLFDEDALDFKEDKIFEKNFSSFIRLKSMLTNKEYDALINNEKQRFKIDVKTTSAQDCLKDLFGTKDSVFPAPKNIGLIKLFATLFEEKDFMVLDFFAGSGTTAHALMELNAEDSGSRKFIVSQIPEACEEKSEALKAGFETIAEICKERIRKVSEKIRREKTAHELEGQDLGFKVLKLQKSNFNEWKDYKGSDVKELMDLFAKQEDALVVGWKPDNLILEVMLQEGFPLHSKIEPMEAIKAN
jgi:adenine-specific DNA-methyltransferase